MKFASILMAVLTIVGSVSAQTVKQPDGVQILTHNTTFSPDEMIAAADVFMAPEWIAVPGGTTVTIKEGSLLRWGGDRGYGAVVSRGLLAHGLWQNLGKSVCIVDIGGTEEIIPPFGMIGVGGVILGSAPTTSHRHCGVTCGTGFYACCTYGVNGGSPTCRCKRVTASNVPCDGGGEGSLTCELDQDVEVVR